MATTDLDFNPRLPRGRRPSRRWRCSSFSMHFNPRLPRGRRLGYDPSKITVACISTHASLAGGDSIPAVQQVVILISTHASLAGGDPATTHVCYAGIISTHASLAGGDAEWAAIALWCKNFNPRLPRGRRQQLFTILPDIFIQNHYFIPLLSAKSLLLLIP